MVMRRVRSDLGADLEAAHQDATMPPNLNAPEWEKALRVFQESWTHPNDAYKLEMWYNEKNSAGIAIC